jgi:hypothetical protein
VTMHTYLKPIIAIAALLVLPSVPLAAPFYVRSSPLVPPTDGVYLSPAAVHAEYNVAPGLQVILKDIQHTGFTNIVRTPVVGGTDETFDSVASGNVSINGGPFSAISLFGAVQVFLLSYTPGDTGTFDTEMLALNLQSTGGGVMIRESPTQQSKGQTTITPQGGGLYRIDSFFDVFTELSLDSGRTWVASVDKTHVDLTNTPLPAAWLLFISGIAALGLLGRRRTL